MKKNRVCELLGIEKPILQGPMSWVSTAPLVAAVSAAGGFGVLGTAMAAPEFIRSQMQTVKQMTDNPFGFNMAFHPVYLNESYFNDVLAVVKDEKPMAVHLDSMCNRTRHFDKEFAKRCFEKWHEADIKIITKVFTMQDALAAQEAGSDLIIVKGWEGGGHLTEQTTMVLVPQATDLLDVPIIAAGGIADGRGMAAAMMLGAEGIEMGTAFIAAEETSIHQNAKRAIIEAGDYATAITGRCADESCRQLRNDLSDRVFEIESMHSAAVAAELIQPLVNRSGRKAMQEGDMINGAVMAGQICAMVKEIRPVKQIIDTVFAQCSELLRHSDSIALQ